MLQRRIVKGTNWYCLLANHKTGLRIIINATRIRHGINTLYTIALVGEESYTLGSKAFFKYERTWIK